jgi:hypothetical protein
MEWVRSDVDAGECCGGFQNPRSVASAFAGNCEGLMEELGSIVWSEVY